MPTTVQGFPTFQRLETLEVVPPLEVPALLLSLFPQRGLGEVHFQNQEFQFLFEIISKP
jgi:hypothetical protein